MPNETAAASGTVSDGLTIPLDSLSAEPCFIDWEQDGTPMQLIALLDGEQDGVQYIRSELDYGGYPVITVRAGIPVEWTIHAEEDHINSCNHEIYIPKFNLSIPLEPGDNLIRFTPDAAGSIPYTCWMGMIRSTIYVIADTEETQTG